jgi:hypothetical protein
LGKIGGLERGEISTFVVTLFLRLKTEKGVLMMTSLMSHPGLLASFLKGFF